MYCISVMVCHGGVHSVLESTCASKQFARYVFFFSFVQILVAMSGFQKSSVTVRLHASGPLHKLQRVGEDHR